MLNCCEKWHKKKDACGIVLKGTTPAAGPLNRTKSDTKKELLRQNGGYGNKSNTLKNPKKGAGDGGKPAHISPGAIPYQVLELGKIGCHVPCVHQQPF